MNIKKSILFTFLVISLSLTACAAPSMAGMPGLSVDGETIFVSYGTEVSAVRSQDGVMVWRYPATPDGARFFFAQPVVIGGQVVVGDYGNVLYGIDRSNGAELWSFKDAKSRWVAGAVEAKDILLAPSADGSLYALNRNGEKKWSFKTQHSIWATPVIYEDLAIIASMDHKIYAIDISSGVEKWNFDLGSAIVRTPLLDGNVLYAGTLGGEIVALDIQKAETNPEQAVVWRFKADGAIWFSPIIYDGYLFFGDSAGKIYSLNASSAEVRWKIEAGAAVMGSAAIIPDGLVFCSENGNVIGVSPTGEKMWSTPVPGKLYTGPIVVGERIIVAVTEGETLLVALDSRGIKQWSFLPPK